MITIPIGITARNEAKNILALLDSLRASVARAELSTACRYELHVILNDNQDHTASLLTGQPDIRIWHTTGGLVEAQRAFAEAHTGKAPFIIFSDADILIDPETVTEITRAMMASPEVQIAYAAKRPMRPVRGTPLAQALYLYNRHEGYQTARHYLNGQFFAIREWNIPKPADLRWDAAANNRFLHLEAGIRCDDIYLSRDILRRFGPDAIHCTISAISYRPPETLRGMFRKYQRMVLEIERLHHYFPESRPAHQQWGRRRLDPAKLAQAPLREKLYYRLFQAALLLCKLAYNVQRVYYSRWSSKPCPTWQPVQETKERMQ